MTEQGKRIWGAVIIVMLYLPVLVYAGHGVGPVGLLLVAGRAAVYVPGMALGWLGIVLLSLACATSHHVVAKMLVRGAVSSFLLSLIWFSWLSQLRSATLATCVPFLVASSWVMLRSGSYPSVRRARSEP